MAGIKIDPEMLDIYMESLNKLMAGSETDGGNARLEVSGAGKTEDGLVRYNEESGWQNWIKTEIGRAHV